MDFSLFLLDMFKITVPALIVAGVAVYIVKLYLNKDQQLRIIETKINSNKETLLLRLQAYERMILLLERMHPASIIQRVIQPGMSANDLKYAIIATVQSEYEHNYAQQLYISSNAWNLITESKTEVLKLVNILSNSTTSETNAHQFSNMIVEAITHVGQPLPSQTALEFLKAEAREIF